MAEAPGVEYATARSLGIHRGVFLWVVLFSLWAFSHGKSGARLHAGVTGTRTIRASGTLSEVREVVVDSQRGDPSGRRRRNAPQYLAEVRT